METQKGSYITQLTLLVLLIASSARIIFFSHDFFVFVAKFFWVMNIIKLKKLIFFYYKS